jgi:hypothetical protein
MNDPSMPEELVGLVRIGAAGILPRLRLRVQRIVELSPKRGEWPIAWVGRHPHAVLVDCAIFSAASRCRSSATTQIASTERSSSFRRPRVRR